MDAVNLDVSALVLIQTSLAFITAPFTSPTYNFPLFLYGIYAAENKESSEPLRLFSALVGLSVLFDFIWLFRHEYNGLIGFIIVIAMLGKIPTFYSILITLRHRGLTFGSVLGRGVEDPMAAQNTVWSMPGGLGGPKAGYQNIDEDLETAPGAPSQPPPPPPSNLPGPSPVSHQAQVPRS
ncbi:hypothetical protein M407DRAFT_242056 [Tulasnella calospora MUT 4182]|uniref:Uncharacterized protein n=1 Tax=Tulasnella calospora MUT 4182 TaxID=1051891 RepID=A0A0C3QSB4_9AGAM|nr:hypothetical protein M407DRAFT_242056 [Tulasnella calospora MUT 4182]